MQADRHANTLYMRGAVAERRRRARKSTKELKGVQIVTRELREAAAALTVVYDRIRSVLPQGPDDGLSGTTARKIATQLRTTKALVTQAGAAAAIVETEAVRCKAIVAALTQNTIAEMTKLAVTVAEAEDEMPPTAERERAMATVRDSRQAAAASAHDRRLFSTVMGFHQRPSADDHDPRLFERGPGRRPHMPGPDAARARARDATPRGSAPVREPE